MKKTINPIAALLMAALLALGLLAGGCESDATAPQDPAPALSEEGAATQAGLVAMAIVQVGPDMISFSEPTKQVYSRTFAGDISGTVFLDFRVGANGVPATWAVGNWVRMYTGAADPLIVTIGNAGGSAQLGLDVNAALNRVDSSAVVGGGGTFSTGPYSAAFTLTDLAIASAAGYPTGGSMTFTGAGYTITVTFDGTNIATVTVSGLGTWYVNLDTGVVSQTG
jgi:hypothetical protein